MDSAGYTSLSDMRSFPNEELQQIADDAGGGFPLLVKERGRVMTETKSGWTDFIIKSFWPAFRLIHKGASMEGK